MSKRKTKPDNHQAVDLSTITAGGSYTLVDGKPVRRQGPPLGQADTNTTATESAGKGGSEGGPGLAPGGAAREAPAQPTAADQA